MSEANVNSTPAVGGPLVAGNTTASMEPHHVSEFEKLRLAGQAIFHHPHAAAPETPAAEFEHPAAASHIALLTPAAVTLSVEKPATPVATQSDPQTAATVATLKAELDALTARIEDYNKRSGQKI